MPIAAGSGLRTRRLLAPASDFTDSGDPLYCPMSRVDADAIEEEDARGEDQRPMKLVSLNTGLPREVTWRGLSVTTAIYKQPVQGRVALRTCLLYTSRCV